MLDDDMNNSEDLSAALHQLSTDEFGGDTSQILFEQVPPNLNCNGLEFRNQFIFPQRIALGVSIGESKEPESLLQIEGKSLGSDQSKKQNAKIAFGTKAP